MSFDFDDPAALAQARTKYLVDAYEEGQKLGMREKDLQDYLRDERRNFSSLVEHLRHEKSEKARVAEREQRAKEERSEREQAAAHELERVKQEHQMKIQELERELALKQEQVRLAPSTNQVSQRTPKIPYFNESRDSIDAYLDRFERYCEVSGWTGDMRSHQLSVLLTGSALDVYTRMPKEDIKDYNKLKQALLRQFDLTEDGYRQRFRTAKPQPKESPSQFVARLKDYFTKWSDMSSVPKTHDGLIDLILMEQYLNTCSRELAVFLKEKSCKSVEDMTQFATQYLDAHSTICPWKRNSLMGSQKSEGPQISSFNHNASARPVSHGKQSFVSPGAPDVAKQSSTEGHKPFKKK